MAREAIPGHAPAGYFERSQRPLQALIFLAPLVVLYEVGTPLFAPDQIAARSLLQHFFETFGVVSYHLPWIAVIVVLLSLHVARRDKWDFEPRLYAVMWIEATLLAVPLFVFMLVLFRQPTFDTPLYSVMLSGTVAHDWKEGLIHSLGAGLYEELVFRLIVIAVVHSIIVDVFALPYSVGAAVSIVVSATLFSWYHFAGSQAFQMDLALYYAGSGVYLAGIYVIRGFGIVAALHAMYDVFCTVVIALNEANAG